MYVHQLYGIPLTISTFFFFLHLRNFAGATGTAHTSLLMATNKSGLGRKFKVCLSQCCNPDHSDKKIKLCGEPANQGSSKIK